MDLRRRILGDEGAFFLTESVRILLYSSDQGFSVFHLFVPTSIYYAISDIIFKI